MSVCNKVMSVCIYVCTVHNVLRVHTSYTEHTNTYITENLIIDLSAQNKIFFDVILFRG